MALLVGPGGAQDEGVGEHRADELQADRQAVASSARTGSVHAGCWVRLNGYENGVQPSIDTGSIGVCPAGRASNAGTATAGVTSRSKRCMNWRMCDPSSPRRRLQPLHVEAAELRTERRLGGEVGIGHGLLLRAELVPQRPRAR